MKPKFDLNILSISRVYYNYSFLLTLTLKPKTMTCVEIPVPYRLLWVLIGNRRLYYIAIEPVQRYTTRDQRIESVGAAGPKTPPPEAARPPSLEGLSRVPSAR